MSQFFAVLLDTDMDVPQSTDNDVTDVVALLRESPAQLGLPSQQIAIRVTLSDRRKKFTDFHRLEVTPEHGPPQFFWLRTIKNKTPEVAQASLRGQFELLTTMSERLQKVAPTGLQLSVCEPVALLLEQCSLITRECPGRLMNNFLLKCIPPFWRRRELIKTYEQVGTWLKAFHHCFRGDVTTDEQQRLLEEFEKTSQVPVREELAYATFCHFDFSPRNIFVGKDLVEVIDFVPTGPGIAQTDVDFFLNYTRDARFNGLYTRGMKAQLCDAFVNAYLGFEAPEIANEQFMKPDSVD